jgi:hypothetical protein
MVDRGDIGPAVGSAVSAAGAAASWIAGSAFLTAVLAAVAGSFVTIYFAGAQQRQAWRRETAVTMTRDLYGPLYVDIWRVLQSFTPATLQNSVVNETFRSDVWPGIVSDYRYLVLEDDLKKQLDSFYALVSETTRQWVGLVNLANRVVLEQTSTFAGISIRVLNWVVRCQRPGQPDYEQAFLPSLALARGEKIMDYVRRSYPGIDSYFFFLQVERTDRSGGNENVALDQAKIGQVFSGIEQAYNANDLAMKHAENVKEIFSTGDALRLRIGVIVKSPWRS